MFIWVQVTPQDDFWQIAEGEVDGDPADVKDYVNGIETDLNLNVVRRLIDPNMGRSPSSSRRGVVWQDEFDNVGLVTDTADDSAVGRRRFDELLKPCSKTLEPRIRIHPRCSVTVHQIKRYVWDDHKRALDKDMKQTPKTKNDDYPTLWKYLMNLEPTFDFLRDSGGYIRRIGKSAQPLRSRPEPMAEMRCSLRTSASILSETTLPMLGSTPFKPKS